MNTIKSFLTLLILSNFVQADLVEFNNGAKLNGIIEDQNHKTLTINIDGKSTTYLKSDIKNITLSQKVSSPPPPPAVKNENKTEKDLILSSGAIIHVITTTQVDTQQHKTGHQFKLKLENDLLSEDGRVIAQKGSDVYAEVIESEQARRLIGKSKMIVVLKAITHNNQRVEINTQALNILTPQSQGRNSVGKVARGAAIGGLVDGHDGARTGAKVGLGMAVLSRGKATGLPAGTLVDFTLSSDIIVKK